MNRKEFLSATGALALGGAACAQEKSAAPSFIGKPADWVNGPPQDLGKLKDKVVIVAVWTFQ